MNEITLAVIQSNKPINDLSQNISQSFKLSLLNKYYSIKLENPKLTQKEICNKLGFSTSTFGRHINDIESKSPSKYLKPKKETPNYNLICEICQKSCKNQHGLNSHISRMHKKNNVPLENKTVSKRIKNKKWGQGSSDQNIKENLGLGDNDEDSMAEALELIENVN